MSYLYLWLMVSGIISVFFLGLITMDMVADQETKWMARACIFSFLWPVALPILLGREVIKIFFMAIPKGD